MAIGITSAITLTGTIGADAVAITGTIDVDSLINALVAEMWKVNIEKVNAVDVTGINGYLPINIKQIWDGNIDHLPVNIRKVNDIDIVNLPVDIVKVDGLDFDVNLPIDIRETFINIPVAVFGQVPVNIESVGGNAVGVQLPVSIAQTIKTQNIDLD